MTVMAVELAFRPDIPAYSEAIMVFLRSYGDGQKNVSIEERFFGTFSSRSRKKTLFPEMLEPRSQKTFYDDTLYEKRCRLVSLQFR
jgi:hypothetical protein